MSTLVAGIAPASLPLIEATVNSVLYGVWRAWQLTRYLAKALSRIRVYLPREGTETNHFVSYELCLTCIDTYLPREGTETYKIKQF